MAHKLAIDFGTTNSILARWNEQAGRTETLTIPGLSAGQEGDWTTDTGHHRWHQLEAALAAFDDLACAEVLAGDLENGNARRGSQSAVPVQNAGL